MDDAPGEIAKHIHVFRPYGRPLAVLQGRADARPNSLPANLSNLVFESDPANTPSIKKPTLRWAFLWMARLERLCRAVLPGTPKAGLQPALGAALTRVQNRSGRFCRTPDRSVRSSTVKMVSSYKSTTCGLDQSQNVVKKSVNEPYLVLCWYIIATYASQQAKSTKADAQIFEPGVSCRPTRDTQL